MKLKQILAATTIVSAVCIATPGISLADDDDKVDAASVTLSIGDAVAIALNHITGTALEAELEFDDGTAVWEVVVMGENDQVSEIVLDANSGEILEVELEDV